MFNNNFLDGEDETTTAHDVNQLVFLVDVRYLNGHESSRKCTSFKGTVQHFSIGGPLKGYHSLIMHAKYFFCLTSHIGERQKRDHFEVYTYIVQASSINI